VSACPRCGAERSTPLACDACGVLFPPSDDLGPFETLGLAPAWKVDAAALRKRLLALTRRTHPDFFADAEPQQRELAERNSALANQAYETLSDDLARADWLVTWLGGPREGELRDMPQTFLMEVLEWNEALEEARDAAPGSPARERLSALARELASAREAALARLGGLLEPSPERGAAALAAARRELNALRYVRRTLDQIEALRLERASPR
jgi:molecular chaperone HscB